MGLSAGVAAFGAVSSYNKAQGQKDMYEYQGRVADINAQTSQQEASLAIQAGQQQEVAQYLKGGQVYATQRVAMAANGVDLGEGSPNEVLASTKYMTQLDVNTIHDNAMRQAWGYQVQATNYTNNAALQRSAADSINPSMSAFSSLLDSATTVANNWYARQKTGAPSIGTAMKNWLSSGKLIGD